MALKRLPPFVLLAACVCLSPLAATAQARTDAGRPLDRVPRLELAPVDVAKALAEDEELAETDAAPRFALPLEVEVSPATHGVWEALADGSLRWRLRVQSKGALSLNLGFTRYFMPPGGQLRLYSPDGKRGIRPFTELDNEAHGELWTPVLFGDELVLEVTLPRGAREALRLELARVNHDYKGFGRPMEKSGACNVDVVCPEGVPWNDQIRAVGVISTGGSTFCTGYLVNNTANDRKPYFMTANHCGIDAGNAASLVVFWNYENSTCRPVGSPASGGPGDGSLSQFQTGSFFRSNSSPSDFTLVELDDAPSPAFDVFFAGWDRTTGDFSGAECVHHPNTDEKRITFASVPTTTTSYNNPAVPGDGTHIHATWSLGVTEPGSSGSPLFSPLGRVIGQLHGGPSACAAADKSDYYGRFSVSWTGGGTNANRLSNWLDPGNTGVTTLDGVDLCTAPSVATALTATPNGGNQVDLSWTAGAGAVTYNLYRSFGACPGAGYTLVAGGLGGTAYSDLTVSGGTTYSYVVRSVDASGGCEAADSNCDDALATGACTLAPSFTGLASAASGGGVTCSVSLDWSAATESCGSGVKYNVYRSTSSGFTPGPGNLLASCLASNSYVDFAVASGTTYHYVVRAEDDSGNGSGLCAGGNEEGNTVQRSTAPSGPSVTATDDVEGSTAYWSTAGGTGSNVWAVVTSASHSPTHAWSVADPAVVTDQRLTTVNVGQIPAAFTLSFWHRFNVEASGGTPTLGYDGGLLEYSTDGATWFDILAGNGAGIPANASRFISGGYTRTISTGFSSPIGGRQAWSGDNLAFEQVQVDLADFTGFSIYLRWRFASDSSVADAGWWVDDVVLRVGGPCGSGCPAVLKGDFNADGRPDLLFRNLSSNRHMVWYMDGVTQTGLAWIAPDPASSAWQAVGTDDFDSASSPGAGPDGTNDVVFYDTGTGAVEFWLMNGVNRVGAVVPLTGAPILALNWKLAATGDFNADGRPDIVWRNVTSQKIVIWKMGEGAAPGTQKTGSIIPSPDQAVDFNWEIVAALDYNDDGNRDFLWYNFTSGKIVTWYMNASVVRITGQFTVPPNAGDNNWKVLAGGDYSREYVPGTPPLCSNDAVWRNTTSGRSVVWHFDFDSTRVHGQFTNPNSPAADPDSNPTAPTDWIVVGPK